MDNLIQMFCEVDDFCKEFSPKLARLLISHGEKKRNRKGQLSLSELLTIMIHFHQSSYRDFKHYYLLHVSRSLAAYFPKLIEYPRFVAIMPSLLLPMVHYLESRKGTSDGIQFVDSTKLAVCHNLRIARNKVFAGAATRGKTTTGWFYGFKLHLVVNDQGEYLSCCITPANVDDRTPVPKLVRGLYGSLFGDKGYISQKLFDELMENGLKLVTGIKRNMKNKLMPLIDKILLRKRFIIETINDQLKNISQIEHTRHRSFTNAMLNIIAGIVAYTYQPKKPSLKFYGSQNEAALMIA
jgi:hypothetical protein